MENIVSDTCRSYVGKRYTCAEKGCGKGPKREGTISLLFGTSLVLNRLKKSSKKRVQKNMEFDTKGVPKESRNRCQKSSKIKAKTGNGKDQENHQKSCFSEW